MNLIAQMVEIRYNTGVNHTKSSRVLEALCYPFSTCERGARTMSDHTPIPYFPENLNDYAPWVAKHGLVAPYGECQCGCGENAPISKVNDFRWGHAISEPVRFIRGHYARIQPIRSAVERFWEKVDKRSPDECWEWQGGKKVENYGGLDDGKGKIVLSHRFSYELHYGPIPEGLFVCHRCDNQKCCNPNHLFVGTALENNNDKVIKGRASVVSGTRHAHAKLNPQKVIEIRQRRKGGESLKSLARSFGVSDHAIKQVVEQKTWRHV